MNKVTCPKCNEDNYSAKTDNRICWHCGAEIPNKSCLTCTAHVVACDICEDYSEYKEDDGK